MDDKQLHHSESRTQPRSRSTRVHRIEWAIGIVSGALVAAMLAYLVALGLTRGDGAPSFVIKIENLQQIGNQTHVTFAIRNEGERTAAEVSVRARRAQMPDDDAREITFDYVPARSDRRGTFVYDSVSDVVDDLSLDVVSYREP
jgi:uncharacterized protein (TIGR02588 family)